MKQAVSFGYWLQQRRKALDLTRAALSQCVGCTAATIRKLEADERRPSKELAARLAGCLQIATNDQAGFARFARGESSRQVPAAIARTETLPWQQPRTHPALPIPPRP